VRFTELPDGGREQGHCGGAHRADPHDAAGLVLPVGGLAEPVDRVQDGHHVLQEITSAFTEPGTVPSAFQQVHA
jgi:hypothetical protein